VPSDGGEGGFDSPSQGQGGKRWGAPESGMEAVRVTLSDLTFEPRDPDAAVAAEALVSAIGDEP
jgi:hypothetical protein